MKILRPIASIVLAALVVVASMGLTINFHICGGDVQSMALFVKAARCSDQQKPCHGTEHHTKKHGCCEDQSVVLKGKQTQAYVSDVMYLAPSSGLIAVLLPDIYRFNNIESVVPTARFALYKPPLPERDIVMFLHSFLI